MLADRTLIDLLSHRFSAEELRRYLHSEPYGRDIARDLPSGLASAMDLAAHAVDWIARRELLDQPFFERLIAERPVLRAQIEAIAHTRSAAASSQVRASESSPGPIIRSAQARSRWFVGRAQTLVAMRDKLLAAHESPTLALTGMGGIGKSQLALEFVYRYCEDEPRYAVAVYASADSKLTLQRELAALAEPLGLRAGSDEEARCQAVRRHLGERGDWLLILDNVESVDAWTWISPLLPARRRGHVILTSRFPHWGEVADEMPVTLLAREESVELLRTRAGRPVEPGADEPVDALAQELGDLPLALMQAAAYVRSAGKSFADYLALFRREHARLLAHSRPADYPETVATTWSLAMARARSERPEAADLLNLSAFLASFPLSVKMLREGAETLPPSLAQLDEIAWDDAVRTLGELSLVTIQPGALWVHQLIQTVTRLRLAPGERSAWNDTALRWATERYHLDEFDARTWLPAAMMFPHLVEAIRCAVEHAPRRESLLRALCKALVERWDGAELGQVRELLAHAARCDFTGEDQLFLEIESARAEVLLAEGRGHEARELLHQLLTRTGAIADERARSAIESDLYNNLAACSGAVGDYEGARRFALKSLEALGAPERVPLDMATALDIVGAADLALGRFEAACETHRKVLVIYDEHAPPPHPQYASVLHNLGRGLLELGSLPEAETSMTSAATMAVQIFGLYHPQCAAIFRGLHRVKMRLGRYEDAIVAARTALRIDEVLLPPMHPLLAEDHNVVGQIALDAGHLDDAFSHLKQALDISVRNHGESNVLTATYRAQYGRVLNAKQQLPAARLQLERALADLEAAGRGDSTEVASVLINLAVLYAKLKQWEPALTTTRRGLALDERLHGPEHPEVADDLFNLGSMLVARREAAAEPHLRRCLAIRERHLPEADPKILQVRVTLVECLVDQDRHAEAIALMDRVFEVLGPVAPADLASLAELRAVRAASLEKLGELKRAAADLAAALAALRRCGQAGSDRFDQFKRMEADLRARVRAAAPGRAR
ncbi:FxSxx-COOH system tetratricopeptide repeat protein [Nannocystis pusilla]|uniref:FxSxx-COOH system tetratricopeptide repeat protein n=1 Tax=Nannocystis pusilla TaxID=889268 RepID=UPI003BF19574